MSRYVDEMTRDELVAEVIGLVRCGVFQDHEVFDPTVLSLLRLRRGVKRLRLRMVTEKRVVIAEGGVVDEAR